MLKRRELVAHCGNVAQALPEQRALSMTDNEMISIDRLKRVLDLVQIGIDVDAIRICIDLSFDDASLGITIGVLEDLAEVGFVRGSGE